MNFKKLLYSCGDKVKEHSPELLMIAGAISFVGTIVLACKATTKASEIIDSHKEQMNSVKALVEDPQIDGEAIEYTTKDARADKAIIFAHTTVDFAKIYWPAVALGTASLLCFFGAFSIVKKRYVAAMTLAAGLSETLSRYRGRVVSELGKEMDEHFLNGTEISKIKGVVDEKTGEVDKSKSAEVQTLNDKNGIPIYAKFFDESNPNWSKSPATSLMFLMGQQARANDLFKIRGRLLLNDVYTMLGIEQTEIGSLVGWFEGHGDQFIDFGLYDNSEMRRAFVNGLERSVLLNFNCVPRLPGDIAYA